MSLRAADLPKAQGESLTALKAAVVDRPPHARYLAQLLDAPADRIDHVPVPADVSKRVAEALCDDVHWCRMPLRTRDSHPRTIVSAYPRAYLRLRETAVRQAAVRRERKAAPPPPPPPPAPERTGPAELLELLTLED